MQLGTYFRAEFMSRLRNPYLQCSDFTDSHKELMFAHLAATFHLPLRTLSFVNRKVLQNDKNWLRSPALILPFFGTPLLRVRVRAGLGFGLD